MAVPRICHRASEALEVPVFIRFFLFLDFAVAFAYLLNFAVGQPLGPLTRLLDLNRERSLATWYASTQLAVLGGLLGLLACRQFDPPRVRSWRLAMLSLLFMALSADEIAGIHELIGEKTDALLAGGTREGTVFERTGIWVFVVGVPGTAIITLLIWADRSNLRAAPGAIVKILVGIVMLATGALAVESMSNFYMAGSGALATSIFLEELLEMVGVTIILWGTIDLLRAYGFWLSFDGSRRSQPRGSALSQ